jgi:hypothetical protein
VREQTAFSGTLLRVLSIKSLPSAVIDILPRPPARTRSPACAHTRMSEYHAAEPVAGPSMDLASGSEQDEQLDLASGSLAQHGRRVGNNKLITAKGKGKGSSLKRSRSSTVDSDVSSIRTLHREPSRELI